MNIDAMKTVREMALNIPGATRVFEQLGIDYCCGGNKPLEQACGEANLQFQQVIDALESATAAQGQARDRPAVLEGEGWQNEALADLVAHIENRHHKYVKAEVARLQPLFQKVCGAHAMKHPELLELQSAFHALAQELTMHMMKEEMVFFPYIVRMEEAVIAGEPILPAPFVTVSNPVAIMIHEHDSAGNLLRAMRQVSNGYQLPEDACMSYGALYSALAEFERDLHQHVHLENNILFPRAIQMEREKQWQP
ncbi:MAG: iron-sulfur cluster repair di-iron protein [Acidobacteria bacterium]|nr:iron-sulfur cluster repair di-iron protein [Acidobacteriota bacterium]